MGKVMDSDGLLVGRRRVKDGEGAKPTEEVNLFIGVVIQSEDSTSQTKPNPFGKAAIGTIRDGIWVDLIDESTTTRQIAEMFSYQRSVVTNRLLRQAIIQQNSKTKIVEHLRDAYFEAENLSERREFSRNQIVYLLGRIDESRGTQAFLKQMWENERNPAVVRHSAAFAAIMLGDRAIEREYYNLLCGSSRDDEINRGYHLYYYEDQNVAEKDMPPADHGDTGAERAMEQLFRRLQRTDFATLNLRRIELFTVASFFKTGRNCPLDLDRAREIVRAAITQVNKRFPDDPEFLSDVTSEAGVVLSLLENPGQVESRLRWRGAADYPVPYGTRC